MDAAALEADGETILQTLYGDVQRLAGRRWRCECNGTAWTVILGVLIALAVLQTPLLAAGHFGNPPWHALGGVAVALALALFARRRHLRMGLFLLDADAGRLVQIRGGRVIGEWPLAEVRFTTAWDWLRQAKSLQHWLIARTPDGKRLRIANGAMQELAPLLDELRSWGLRVG